MSTALELYAEKVRRQAHKIMTVAIAHNDQRIADLAGALCTEAAGIASQSQMAAEVDGGYDLAALPSPSASMDPE